MSQRVTVGRRTVEGPESVSRGTRSNPARILARVDVFPHGPCEVKSEFQKLVKRIPELDLKRDGDVGKPGEEHAPQILESNPWAVRPTSQPTGASGATRGSTHVWVEYWHWNPRSLGTFMRDLLTPTRDPNRPADLPYLEVSCLTWAYEIGSERDFETSLVIELHTFISGGLFERERLKDAAPRLARELETLLKQLPASDGAVEMRRTIAALRQREIDEKQRQRQAAMEASQAERERQRREEHEQKERRAEEAKRLNGEFQRQLQQNEQKWNEDVEKSRREADERVFWHSAKERDRRNAEILENRRREEADRALRTVAVLYDSSYLMGDERQKPSLHATFTWLAGATVTNIVAHEVQIELGRHLSADDPHLQKSARRARGRLLALAEEAQRAGDGSYQEAKLSAVVADPGPNPDPLGPDSPTDRILIEYGCHLLRAKLFRVVVIATNDGGIRRDVMSRRDATGLPIFALADPFDSIQSQPFQEAVFAIDRDV